ncbi:anthranilate synthase component I family protein [Crocinitomix catalasitica]|nr:anthranilate synthase component I family protein [Crocinitomix catalasitica]
MRKYQAVNIDLSLEALLERIENESSMLLQRSKENFIAAWGIRSTFNFKVGQIGGEISDFIDAQRGEYLFGYFCYDLKNEFEDRLSSRNEDQHNFPLIHLFVPEHVLIANSGILTYYGEAKVEDIEEFISVTTNNSKIKKSSIILKSQTPKADYIANVETLKDQIQLGMIYEVNYCINFTASETKNISGVQMYANLFRESEAPFSVFYNHDDCQIISASPERFIRKYKGKLYSEPIKGTARRGLNSAEDDEIGKRLQNDPKERSENIMITDLVRNDLSRVAAKNSVKVENLCELKSFKTVHQLVSTISCDLKEGVAFLDILKATFPMGSMTGAPKISAMENSERYETFRRGLYSGSIGFIDPNGNFDFNVVIRSFIRNKKSGLLTAAVGGAITIDSDPEMEYEECLLKLKALQNILS